MRICDVDMLLFDDGLGAGADVEFVVDVADVGAHGFLADTETLGDLIPHPTKENGIGNSGILYHELHRF